MRLSGRRALLVAAGITVMVLGTARTPAMPAAASHTYAMAVGDFHEVAAQGFGDPQNSWAWSMAWYKDRLYVGTNRAARCNSVAAAHRVLPGLVPYPPVDHDLAVPCTPAPQNLPLAAQIWRLNPRESPRPTQADWQKVYTSPPSVPVRIGVTTAITLAPRDMGFRGMSIYTDTNGEQALYVSGTGTADINGPRVPPPSLLRTTDGVNFHAVPADPGTTMGDINVLPNIDPHWHGASSLRGQASYKGRFYILVIDPFAGAVFESPDPRRGDNSFQRVTPPGMLVFEIQAFNNHLYLGVGSSTQGYSVWRTDMACRTLPCPLSAFKQVVPPGAGLGASGDEGVTSMHVFTDPAGVPHLYVGADGVFHQTPAEIVRINQDDSWDLIMGPPRTVGGVVKAPTSNLDAGFGWWFNQHIWRMEDYHGVLYASTFDTSTSWKDSAVGTLLQPWMGFDLWASHDGLTFLPVTLDGFGDRFSSGGRTLQATPYGLFVGSANPWKGLRIWEGGIVTGALQSAPSNLQIGTAAGTGAIALVWDAPARAATYHVYRSQALRLTLPRYTRPGTDVASGAPLSVAPARTSIGIVKRPSLSAHPHAAGKAEPKPRTRIWLPGAYTEVAMTTLPYFVDHTARAGGHYTYVVVAEDAYGMMSAPSNASTVPSLTPPTTFQSVNAMLETMGTPGKLGHTWTTTIRQTLRSAAMRLRAGDAQGSHAFLDRLRRDLLSRARGALERLGAESMADQLDRLEQRVTLVGAHVVSASDVQ